MASVRGSTPLVGLIGVSRGPDVRPTAEGFCNVLRVRLILRGRSMTRPVTRRQALLTLLSAPAIAALGGCGEDKSNIAVLPDQGEVVLPRKSGERKPQKGMDRDGS